MFSAAFCRTFKTRCEEKNCLEVTNSDDNNDDDESELKQCLTTRQQTLTVALSTRPEKVI